MIATKQTKSGRSLKAPIHQCTNANNSLIDSNCALNSKTDATQRTAPWFIHTPCIFLYMHVCMHASHTIQQFKLYFESAHKLYIYIYLFVYMFIYTMLTVRPCACASSTTKFPLPIFPSLFLSFSYLNVHTHIVYLCLAHLNLLRQMRLLWSSSRLFHFISFLAHRAHNK